MNNARTHARHCVLYIHAKNVYTYARTHASTNARTQAQTHARAHTHTHTLKTERQCWALTSVGFCFSTTITTRCPPADHPLVTHPFSRLPLYLPEGQVEEESHVFRGRGEEERHAFKELCI